MCACITSLFIAVPPALSGEGKAGMFRNGEAVLGLSFAVCVSGVIDIEICMRVEEVE